MFASFSLVRQSLSKETTGRHDDIVASGVSVASCFGSDETTIRPNKGPRKMPCSSLTTTLLPFPVSSLDITSAVNVTFARFLGLREDGFDNAKFAFVGAVEDDVLVVDGDADAGAVAQSPATSVLPSSVEPMVEIGSVNSIVASIKHGRVQGSGPNSASKVPKQAACADAEVGGIKIKVLL